MGFSHNPLECHDLNTPKCLVTWSHGVKWNGFADRLKWTAQKSHAAGLLRPHHAIFAMLCFIWDVKRLRIDDNHDDLTSSAMHKFQKKLCKTSKFWGAELWVGIQISNQKNKLFHTCTHVFLVLKFVRLAKKCRTRMQPPFSTTVKYVDNTSRFESKTSYPLLYSFFIKFRWRINHVSYISRIVCFNKYNGCMKSLMILEFKSCVQCFAFFT